MAAYNTKPGVDWNLIKADFDSGLSLAECVRRQCERGVKITKRAIQKRRDKEGWDKKAAIYAAATKLPSVIAQATGAATTRHRNEDKAKSVLASLAQGLPYRTAARLAGMSDDTLARWRESDAAFADQCEAAIEAWHATMVGHVEAAAPRDWKAAQWRLQTHSRTKADYADSQRAGTIIQVNVAVDRAEPDTVTVEHKS